MNNNQNNILFNQRSSLVNTSTRVNNRLYCCALPITYKILDTGTNNPQITKAMRYSQYINNPANSKTVINR
jgi:hypothetical protein